jgi:hypothetical protein
MKRSSLLLSLLAALALGFTGCKDDGAVDTSKVESTFAGADAGAKADLDKVVSAVKAGDYSGAMTSLQGLAKNAKLTPDQQTALNDLLTQLQAKAKEAMAKAGEQATDAAKKATEAAGDAAKKAGDAAGGALKDLGNQIKK